MILAYSLIWFLELKVSWEKEKDIEREDIIDRDRKSIPGWKYPDYALGTLCGREARPPPDPGSSAPQTDPEQETQLIYL